MDRGQAGSRSCPKNPVPHIGEGLLCLGWRCVARSLPLSYLLSLIPPNDSPVNRIYQLARSGLPPPAQPAAPWQSVVRASARYKC